MGMKCGGGLQAGTAPTHIRNDTPTHFPAQLVGLEGRLGFLSSAHHPPSASRVTTSSLPNAASGSCPTASSAPVAGGPPQLSLSIASGGSVMDRIQRLERKLEGLAAAKTRSEVPLVDCVTGSNTSQSDGDGGGDDDDDDRDGDGDDDGGGDALLSMH